jgi:hypothetical protein
VRILSRIFWLTNYYGEMDSVTAPILHKYHSVAEEIDSSSVLMYTDIPEYQNLMNELTAVGIDVKEHQRIKFSPQEIDSAQLLSFHPTYEDLNPYSEDPGGFQQPSCMECKAYIHQTGNLLIRTSSMGKRNFIFSWEHQLLVSPKVKSLFESEELTGVNFRPAFQKDSDEPIAYQLIPTSVFPTCNKQNLFTSDHCSKCGFITYGIPQDTVLQYTVDVLHDAKDFNHTAEYFGSGWFPGREIIVSQRVRSIINKAKLRGVRYQPIMLNSDLLN